MKSLRGDVCGSKGKFCGKKTNSSVQRVLMVQSRDFWFVFVLWGVLGERDLATPNNYQGLLLALCLGSLLEVFRGPYRMPGI